MALVAASRSDARRSHGPRTPEQLALASLVVEEDDRVAFDAAVAQAAILWTLNRGDFVGIPALELGP